jgi:hypothetical protein
MSAQESKNTGSNPRRRQQARPVYWLWSIGFHSLLLLWLIFFSPVRIIDLQARKAQFTASNAKITEVMDYVREHQADLLKSRVEELLSLQQELSDLETRKAFEFNAFMQDFSQTGGDKIRAAQAAAQKAIAEAIAAQKAAKASLAEAHKSGDTNAWAKAAAAQKQSQEAQWKASQNMDRALQALALAGSAMDQARQAQAAANVLQSQADKVQTDASDARDASRSASNDQERRKESVAKAEASLMTAELDALEAKARATTNQTDLAQAQVEYEQTKATSDEAKKATENESLTKEEMKAARAQHDQAKKITALAQRKVSDTGSKLKTAERKVEQTVQKIESAQKKLELARQEQQKAEEKVAAARKPAVELQVQAQTLETQVQQAQIKAQQVTLAAQAAMRQTSALAALPLTNKPASSMSNLNNLDLAGLYQTAVQTESAMTEVYREVRATDLAMIRQIPLDKAKKLTDVAKTVRPDLTQQLRKKVEQGDEVNAMRETVQTAANEINSMVNAAYTMLATAKGIDQSGSTSAQGVSISLEAIHARADQAQMMEELAAEDSNARAKDLAGAMSGGGKAGRAAGAAGAGAAGGGGGKSGKDDSGGGGRLLEPPVMPKNLQAIPARKVTGFGQPNRWAFVDSWYVIGPWDNAGRANIETKFPPETVVDLDAVYIGKDSQQVRWYFHQAAEPRIFPPFDHFHPERQLPGMSQNARLHGLEYIIYYAYTELYFDQPRDLWIAVGSDDYSKLWIEDQLVWASGKQQKQWRPDEGLRRVHFKQGINRVLFRVENGWNTTQFSLCLCMGEK